MSFTGRYRSLAAAAGVRPHGGVLKQLAPLDAGEEGADVDMDATGFVLTPRDLAVALKFLHSTHLRELVLDRVALGAEGGAQLAPWVRRSHSLVRLSAAEAQLGDDGAAQLLRALREAGAQSPVRELDLSNNQLTARVAAAVADALGEGRCLLTALTLSNNRIGDAGGATVAAALEANYRLRELGLTRTTVGFKTVQAFLKTLAANSTLRSLEVSYNSISPAQMQALAAAMGRNEQAAAAAAAAARDAQPRPADEDYLGSHSDAHFELPPGVDVESLTLDALLRAVSCGSLTQEAALDALTQADAVPPLDAGPAAAPDRPPPLMSPRHAGVAPPPPPPPGPDTSALRRQYAETLARSRAVLNRVTAEVAWEPQELMTVFRAFRDALSSMTWCGQALDASEQLVQSLRRTNAALVEELRSSLSPVASLSSVAASDSGSSSAAAADELARTREELRHTEAHLAAARADALDKDARIAELERQLREVEGRPRTTFGELLMRGGSPSP